MMEKTKDRGQSPQCRFQRQDMLYNALVSRVLAWGSWYEQDGEYEVAR